MAAAQQGHTKAVMLLLPNSDLTHQTSWLHQTALHLACRGMHIDVACLLVSRGASPHIPDENGETPLDLVFLDECRELLLQAEAECNGWLRRHPFLLFLFCTFRAKEELKPHARQRLRIEEPRQIAGPGLLLEVAKTEKEEPPEAITARVLHDPLLITSILKFM